MSSSVRRKVKQLLLIGVVLIATGLIVLSWPAFPTSVPKPLAFDLNSAVRSVVQAATQAGYDGDGNQAAESILAPETVGRGNFGKVGTYLVDDYVYATPLYVPRVTVAGHLRNLLIVATMNTSLYAFDADMPGSLYIWRAHFNAPLPSSSYPGAGGPHPGFVVDHMGCMAAPVADIALGKVFALCSDGVNYSPGLSSPGWLMHGLNLESGREPITAVRLAGHVNGTGDPGLNRGRDTASQALPSGWYAPADSSNPGYVPGQVQFWGLWELARTALRITNGFIVSGFAAYGDARPGHGWVMLSREIDLTNIGAWCSTCQLAGLRPGRAGDPGLGSVWGGKSATVIDPDGNIIVVTGNGSDKNASAGITPRTNYGNSIVKLSPSLTVLDFFLPSDYSRLNALDLDQSAGGLTLWSSQRKVVSCAKSFECYSVPIDDMGHLQGTDGEGPQLISFGLGRTPTKITGAYSSLILNRSLYVPMVDGPIQKFSSTLSGYFVDKASASTSMILNSDPKSTGLRGIPFPGGSLSGSYDGLTGTGMIVWVNMPTAGAVGLPTDQTKNSNAFNTCESGRLVALRGSDLSLIWNSDGLNADSLGTYAKFVPPVVANGRVYVANWDKQIVAYGLAANQPRTKPVALSPQPSSPSHPNTAHGLPDSSAPPC